MHQHINSIQSVQAKRLEETGYALTATERERLDRRHRFWAAFTGAACLGLIGYLAAYPSFVRFLT